MKIQQHYLELVIKSYRDVQSSQDSILSLAEKSIQKHHSEEERELYKKWAEWLLPVLDAQSKCHEKIKRYYEQTFNTTFDPAQPFKDLEKIKNS